MTSTRDPIGIDAGRLEGFVGRAVEDVGAALNAALVVMGDRMGLYRVMAGAGPLTPADVAARAGSAERYVREWLNAQAAGGYVEYEAQSGRYTLPAEQAAALTDAGSSAHLAGLFQLALGCLRDAERVLDAMRTGDGVSWEDHVDDVHEGWERALRPAYHANLLSHWLPALDGVIAKLDRGALVADVGCRRGASTIIMATAYPRSLFRGSDPHAASVEAARRGAAAAGVDGRATFEVTTAAAFTGGGYDLVTMFDRLHELGDPVRAARHVREALAPEGRWLIVEPAAGERVEDNLTPVGRLYYSLSTLLCTPAALSQGVGLALGAQAGESRLRDVVTAGGFSGFRAVARTPLHLVYEARP